MSVDPTARTPAPGFTRAVRAGTTLYALAVLAFWVWSVVGVSLGEAASPFLAPLAFVGGALIGGPAIRLWRWAGQPRLSQLQQRAIVDALRGPDRRAVSRAIRRGDQPPAGLEQWALPYAQAQHQLVSGSCALLLLTSGLLVQLATAPHLHTGGWIQVGIAIYTLATGTGMLRYAGQARRSTARWAALPGVGQDRSTP